MELNIYPPPVPLPKGDGRGIIRGGKGGSLLEYFIFWSSLNRFLSQLVQFIQDLPIWGRQTLNNVEARKRIASTLDILQNNGLIPPTPLKKGGL